MSTPRYVAYYRVSTDKQGRSGLGLEAQRAAVAAHVASAHGAVAAEFVEIESGRKKDRPQLAAALAAARAHRAVLVIAKLDRLARNVHFVSGLMESGAEFVAADMPTVNRLTVHILAAVAEEEARMISARTKAALAAARPAASSLAIPACVRAARSRPMPQMASRLAGRGREWPTYCPSSSRPGALARRRFSSSPTRSPLGAYPRHRAAARAGILCRWRGFWGAIAARPAQPNRRSQRGWDDVWAGRRCD